MWVANPSRRHYSPCAEPPLGGVVTGTLSDEGRIEKHGYAPTMLVTDKLAFLKRAPHLTLKREV